MFSRASDWKLGHFCTMSLIRTARFARAAVPTARRGFASQVASSATPATQAMRKLRLMTAIKTPYRADGTLDLVAYDQLVEMQLANGVEGFVVGGTTGEGHLLNWEEHIMLIAHTVSKFGSRCMVVGNTGSNSTKEAVKATEQGFAVGMHCALEINPYYGKTSEAGILAHLERSMEFGPSIIYNVPGRTNQDIEPELMLKLAEHPHFVGVKECMGRERIQFYSDRGVTTFSGNDDDCHEVRHEAGCQGVISVTANLVPGLFRRMMDAPSPEIDDSLKPLYSMLFKEPNPIGLNTMLMMCGLVNPVFRLPYLQMSLEDREAAKQILLDIGLENLPGVSDIEVLSESTFEHLPK